MVGPGASLHCKGGPITKGAAFVFQPVLGKWEGWWPGADARVETVGNQKTGLRLSEVAPHQRQSPVSGSRSGCVSLTSRALRE